ncbi:hypothetical protein HDU98_005283, partial [Podochytrium sp. JEL0797]
MDAQPKLFYRNPTLHQIFAGLAAGATTTVLLHPLDIVKIRFQINENRGGIFRGTLSALGKIRAQDGFRGLYRGLPANVIASTVAWGFYFTCYDHIKNEMQHQIDRKNGHTPTYDSTIKTASKLTPLHHLVASAVTGVITISFTNPLWIMKIRFCADRKSDPGAYSTFRHGITSLVREEGVRGLYRGIVPALFGV